MDIQYNMTTDIASLQGIHQAASTKGWIYFHVTPIKRLVLCNLQLCELKSQLHM